MCHRLSDQGARKRKNKRLGSVRRVWATVESRWSALGKGCGSTRRPIKKPAEEIPLVMAISGIASGSLSQASAHNKLGGSPRERAVQGRGVPGSKGRGRRTQELRAEAPNLVKRQPTLAM